jgi:NADPH-dependent 2,4-dienoyl-CoA reductase/sulfur reductase-like enzyme
MALLSRLPNPIFHPFLFVFQIFQWLTDLILAPTPPSPNNRGKPLGRPKIAVIGAGITGVSSAAHCVGHGFDVTIFEAGTKKNLGGIWSVSYD